MNSHEKHSGKLEIFKLASTDPVILKPFNESLLAGASGYQSFSSPADDYPEMDLFSFLIKNSETTFPAKIEGDCLSEIGVYNNDWAIIEKGLTPKELDLVAVYIDDQPYIKRFNPKYDSNNRLKSLQFKTANKNYADFDIDETTSFLLWGVIVGIVRKYR
ncbi:LexA family protein [Chryseobacterium oncorhynchi]|uniref:Peptidase S24/S26A/S26B/S26C domain-containing protein n=1 Tax=Chryseobacterium oncorhynchi TaxID=741074 RepID=A0A316WNB2_9FLAO|nr:S24 family peptidase [Chryseobacterium oncorhynchi]PWN60030.1 hypothetical protein C1638_020910 [Chryseobacterium oncorhynchi]